MYSSTLFILANLLLIQYVQGIPRVDPLVDTKLGLIRGVRASDGDYSMFLGIPFATVDETNPFGASTPYPPFDSVFEAYDDTGICPQIEEFNNTIVGSLDCLHLNIYVPDTASSRNRLPVLVWIYGGGFSIGFAGRYLYGPKYLVRHDIILVAINYRLGPYGFMCLDTPEVPGNQGLKDQLLALRWVRDNIESFGGDNNQITIFGESAGGGSVDYHLIYKQENLFNRVVIESGTSLIPGLLRESSPSAPLQLAAQLGFETNDLTEALSFLSSTDPKLVIAAGASIDNYFRPCVEQEFDNVEAFILEHPVNMMIPQARGMPILIGFNSNETISTYANAPPEYFENLDVFNDLLLSCFDFDDNDLAEMVNLVRHFYIGDENISIDARQGITDFATHIRYGHPAERSIVKYIQNGADKIFYYVFSYNGGRNFVKRRNNVTSEGASHADEIGYLFDISFFDEEPTANDQLVIDRMTAMWANFAKFGDPTPQTSDLLPVKWEPITRDSPHYYMDIDKDLTLGKRPFNDRMAFWDLFYKLNEKLQKGYRDNV